MYVKGTACSGETTNTLIVIQNFALPFNTVALLFYNTTPSGKSITSYRGFNGRRPVTPELPDENEGPMGKVHIINCL